MNESCSYVLENKLCGRLETDREEPSFMVRYEAAGALQEILNEATKNNKKDKKKPTGKINLNTIKGYLHQKKQRHLCFIINRNIFNVYIYYAYGTIIIVTIFNIHSHLYLFIL